MLQGYEIIESRCNNCTMGPKNLTCPLCCGEDFPCRDSLRRHITDALHNIRCPACQKTLLSLSDLISHLEADQCGGYPMFKEDTVDQLEPSDNISEETSTVTENDKELKDLVKFELARQEEHPLNYVNSGHKTISVMEDGDNHILIVGNDAEHLLANQNIITTQNEDGTISFTPVDYEQMESTEEERLSPEAEESEGEVYSCNTCGVSFTSVIDHIQKYHSEQDVVVEVAETESEMLSEELRDETTGSKRVITTTGDIVVEEFSQTSHTQKDEDEQDVMEEEVVDKSGRTYTRRIIKIDKFWDEESIDNKAKLKALVGSDVETESASKVYSCRRCLTRSTSIEALQNHFCKKDGVYNCSQCPVSYTNPKSLCAHMKVHKIGSKSSNSDTPGEKKSGDGTMLMLFKCEVCDTVFPSNKSLRLHKRMHEPVKSRPMEGPNGETDSTDTYLCTLCDKWIHIGYKDIHENYHHSSEQYHCEICNRKFLSQDYLVMHMNVHNMEKTTVNKSDKVLPYSCLYCHRQFARPHEKVKHERIHTGEKPHTCEICGKAFRVSYCLTLHMRTHTGARPYECQHCGKRFKAHSVYNHHLLTHSDVRAFKCPYCPKAFKTSVQLAGHKNSHTKPFSCTHCNRPFASLYAVRVHTETHRRQNNLKFSCKLCGASYARAFALKDHMKSVHENVADNTEYITSEAVFETDPALAILPKTEDNLEVEGLRSSSIKSEIVINNLM